jgi:hypothetical protein
MASWDAYFEWVRTLDLPDDFMRERQQPEVRRFADCETASYEVGSLSLTYYGLPV